MSRYLAAMVAAIALLVAAGPAAAVPVQTGQTVTATGIGQARVHVTNRHNNAAIAAAVEAARQASVGKAVAEANEYANEYAAAAGLTLGSILSVSDVTSSGGFGYGAPGVVIGPFGPGKFCGKIHEVVRRPRNGHKPKFKTVHRCLVPPFATTTLAVTYSAS